MELCWNTIMYYTTSQQTLLFPPHLPSALHSYKSVKRFSADHVCWRSSNINPQFRRNKGLEIRKAIYQLWADKKDLLVFQVFQGSGIENKEDNLTSADPLSIQLTDPRWNQVSASLLEKNSSSHSLLWIPVKAANLHLAIPATRIITPVTFFQLIFTHYQLDINLIYIIILPKKFLTYWFWIGHRSIVRLSCLEFRRNARKWD